MPDVTALSMTDAQPKTGPALSATSDMPEVKAAPPALSAEVNNKAGTDPDPKPDAEAPKPDAEKPEGDAAEGDQPDPEQKADAEGEGDIDVESDKTPAWMKALATKSRNKVRAAETARKAAETKADALTANLTKALESIETLTKTQAAKITEAADKEDPRPTREAFGTPEEYDSALIDWSGRRAALVATAEVEKTLTAKADAEKAEETKAATAKQNQEIADAFAERKTKFVEVHPDYDDLVETDDLQISIPMAQVILNDDDGPAMAYYLGQNPDEAERISKLSPVKAIAEMGRIAARLAAKPIPSAKPAPLKVLKTGTEVATRKTPHEESMEEYGARRSRERANEARSRIGLSPLN